MKRKPKFSVEGRARNRLAMADDERQADIPDRVDGENRQPFPLLLKSAGFHDMQIEPRLGYVAWRAVDMGTGNVLHSAALKELLHWIADQLPRMISPRATAQNADRFSARDEEDARRSDIEMGMAC